KRYPSGLACRDELRALGQEAVAGMDRLGASRARDAQHLLLVHVAQIGSQLDALVGQAHVQRATVGGLVERHRRDAHVAAGAHDADGDLAAVGHQYFREHNNPYMGEIPCFLGRCRSRFEIVRESARMSTRRLSRGSITSSISPRAAATYGVLNCSWYS